MMINVEELSDFEGGNAVDNLLIITRGEVDLILKVEDHELVLHNLYQGCYMGGYKVLKDSIYSHTARAVTSVTLHSLSKDSISLLQKNLPDFNHAIEKARIFIDNTSDPFIGFGMFRSKETSLTPIKLFKMAVIKVLKINRDLKEAGIKEGVPDILKRTVIGYYNEEEEGRKPHNYQKTSLKILQKLTKKIDFLERHIKTLEKEVKNGAKYQNRSHRLFKQLRMQKNNTNTSLDKKLMNPTLDKLNGTINMNNSRYSFHMNATEESKIDEHTLEDYSSSEESVSVSKTNSTSQFQEQNNLTKKKSEISMGILYSNQLKDKKAIYSGESFGKKPDER